MKLRKHRGGLSASMATVRDVEPSALRQTVINDLAVLGWHADPAAIHVQPYGGLDDRIGWDTHIVTVDGYGVFGFTDGPMDDHERAPTGDAKP